MSGIIEIITEAGYRLTIGKDYTEVKKDGKTKRFIGDKHRLQAVGYVVGRA
jgi:hypothetical protein